VNGKDDKQGFSYDPEVIHYGSNSAFQAVNLAGHFIGWVGRIVLIGVNMQVVSGKSHFFGEHPRGLRNTTNYSGFITAFERAKKTLPDSVQVLNATPNSALKCFPRVDLHDALSNFT
jgi:hypothetical protein